MTTFLVIGTIGVLLLLSALILDDHLHGVFDALGGGDIFTGASLAGFLGGLGYGGALVLGLSDNLGLAIGGGLAVGLTLGALASFAIFKLRRIGDDSAPSQKSILGRTGIIITPVPVDGFGEVRVVDGGHMAKLAARSDQPLPAGTEVWISESLSATSVFVQPTHLPQDPQGV